LNNAPVLVHNAPCGPGRLSDPLPQGLSKAAAKAYDDILVGEGKPRLNKRGTAQAVFEGNRPHERPWRGALEWEVPGAKNPDDWRILQLKMPDGRMKMAWTDDHYDTIHPFSAPHFPDSGW